MQESIREKMGSSRRSFATSGGLAFFGETLAQEYLAPALKEAQDLVLDSQKLAGRNHGFLWGLGPQVSG